VERRTSTVSTSLDIAGTNEETPECLAMAFEFHAAFAAG
jgi:hypothetical protein